MGLKIFFIAGEVSGDNYCAALVRELKKRVGGLRMSGVGGDRMKEEGVELIAHIRELSVVGFIEILSKLFKIIKIYRAVIKKLEKERPFAAILVDFPDFNLKVAKVCRRLGIRVIYYISPQVWAWRRGRVKKLKKFVDELIVILPFEKDFYRTYGIEAHYFGHPIVDTLKEVRSLIEDEPEENRDGVIEIALIPGSRQSEIKYNLPILIKTAKEILKMGTPVRFLIPVAPNLDKGLFERWLKGCEHIFLHPERWAIWRVLKRSKVAIVSSGTATLETALMRVPMVIIYRMAHITSLIGMRLLKSPFIGLVNHIAGRMIVKEFIQHIDPERLAKESVRLIEDKDIRDRMMEEFDRIEKMLGEAGVSQRIAEFITSIFDRHMKYIGNR